MSANDEPRDVPPDMPPDGAGDNRRENGRRASDREAVHLERLRAQMRDEMGRDEESAPVAPTPEGDDAIVQLEDVWLAFDRPILEGVSFAAYKGQTITVVGESGTGKSTILKLILRLLVAERGQVCVNGEDVGHLTYEEALKMRQQMGMVFQGSALFDSLSVFENVAYPLREHTKLDEHEIAERVRQKLSYVDLDPDQVMSLAPSELSGGMQKRVGIARGLAADPAIMLYDEPTSGLDPLTTATITNLIMKLQRDLGVTSIVVTHDIRSAFRMATRVALLHERRIVFFGTPEEMTASSDPYIQSFLGGY
jgi:phospholipid/cholesterol/gamma-HCH transport system ATP-binding protein